MQIEYKGLKVTLPYKVRWGVILFLVVYIGIGCVVHNLVSSGASLSIGSGSNGSATVNTGVQNGGSNTINNAPSINTVGQNGNNTINIIPSKPAPSINNVRYFPSVKVGNEYQTKIGLEIINPDSTMQIVDAAQKVHLTRPLIFEATIRGAAFEAVTTVTDSGVTRSSGPSEEYIATAYTHDSVKVGDFNFHVSVSSLHQ